MSTKQDLAYENHLKCMGMIQCELADVIAIYRNRGNDFTMKKSVYWPVVVNFQMTQPEYRYQPKMENINMPDGDGDSEIEPDEVWDPADPVYVAMVQEEMRLQ